ncbi:MAG: hypothetical protein ACRDT6_14320, partial [Micromonosporaceae bacterium]
MLLVVDSLDEAADLAGQASRLHELTSLHGWRFVVTSRPAAWDATYRGEPDRADGPRVVALQDLEYPGDVVAFAQAWFAADPSRGDALIKQIRARDDLARVGVIPQMLTFYCLLSEAPADAARPLPARRQDLYRRLVRRLLRSMWATNAPGPDTAPDMAYCEALLTQWAWHAVHNRTMRGRSPGACTVPVLEHFVAEHIATLDPNEAARIPLPHLWFDPDWKVTAPAAIAAHNHRQRGDLFQQLPKQAAYPATDPARQAASREFDRLLLAIAEESEPDDWTPELQGVFHKCRERNGTSEPVAVARTAHWTGSNNSARAALLAALRTADPWAVDGLVSALPALGPSDAERAEARTALPTASISAVGGLVAALPALVSTDAERAAARTRPARRPAHHRPGGPRGGADRYGPLRRRTGRGENDWNPPQHYGSKWGHFRLAHSRGPHRLARRPVHRFHERRRRRGGGADRFGPLRRRTAEVRAALLAALRAADPWAVDGLVSALPALGPSDAERA